MKTPVGTAHLDSVTVGSVELLGVELDMCLVQHSLIVNEGQVGRDILRGNRSDCSCIKVGPCFVVFCANKNKYNPGL